MYKRQPSEGRETSPTLQEQVPQLRPVNSLSHSDKSSITPLLTSGETDLPTKLGNPGFSSALVDKIIAPFV